MHEGCANTATDRGDVGSSLHSIRVPSEYRRSPDAGAFADSFPLPNEKLGLLTGNLFYAKRSISRSCGKFSLEWESVRQCLWRSDVRSDARNDAWNDARSDVRTTARTTVRSDSGPNVFDGRREVVVGAQSGVRAASLRRCVAASACCLAGVASRQPLMRYRDTVKETA